MIGWPLALKWAVLWASCDSQHPTCPHTVQTRRLKSLWQPSHVCERGPPSCPSRGGIPPSSSLPSVLIHFRRRCARLLELEAWSLRVIQSPHQLLRPPFDPRHVVELDLQPERAQERRMEVVAEPFGLGEQAAGLSEERLLQMQPRHLVLILVRHQLVQVADHSMSQE